MKEYQYGHHEGVEVNRYTPKVNLEGWEFIGNSRKSDANEATKDYERFARGALLIAYPFRPDEPPRPDLERYVTKWAIFKQLDLGE